MRKLRYLDLDLSIERRADGFLAKVLHSPAGEVQGTFAFPFSEDRLENLVLKLGFKRHATRRAGSAGMDAARELGGRLFDAVFADDLRSCLRASLEAARGEGDAGLRIRLRLQGAPELADVPWEYLYDRSQDRFLAQSVETPLVRYLELPERIKPMAAALPLRLLVVAVNAPGQVELDVEKELGLLKKALAPLVERGAVAITDLRNATLAELLKRLRSGTFHVFHFIGHGAFDETTDEGVLLFADDRGQALPVEAHRIGTLLHDHSSLRLAVLNSCEGARNSRTDPLAGVATTLVRQGVPAVVAMQFEISDAAAVVFAGEFYAALADGFPVDAAVGEARKAIYLMPNDVEWGTPVLYLRAPDGVLFEWSEPAEGGARGRGEEERRRTEGEARAPGPGDPGGLREVDESKLVEEAVPAGAPAALAALLAASVALGKWLAEVARHGRDGRSYQKTIGGADYLATPSSVYADEAGRRCRTVRTSKRVQGRWVEPPAATFFWSQGDWHPLPGSPVEPERPGAPGGAPKAPGARVEPGGTVVLAGGEPFVRCPRCGARVKARNMDLHLNKVHPEA